MSGFYRAHVLEVVDAKHVKVQYVDYGYQTEVLAINNLNIMIEKTNPPMKATLCSADDDNNNQEEIYEVLYNRSCEILG